MDAFPSEAIQIRRVDLIVAGAPHDGAAMLVRLDDEDIGAFGDRVGDGFPPEHGRPRTQVPQECAP